MFLQIHIYMGADMKEVLVEIFNIRVGNGRKESNEKKKENKENGKEKRKKRERKTAEELN